MGKRYTKCAVIHSFTNPDKQYAIKQEANTGIVSCGCPAWRFNLEKHAGSVEDPRTCKHLRAIFQGQEHVLDRILLYSGKYDIEIDGDKWKIEEA